MDNLDMFLPDIALRASEWTEKRFGRLAGWAVFLGLLIGLPCAIIVVAISYILRS